MCPRERFTSYKSLSRLVLCYKKDWATLLHLCYLLRIIFSQNYVLPIISVLVENTLLKITCHFHLFLIVFDTLTYRKDYDRSPILVGHQGGAGVGGGVGGAASAVESRGDRAERVRESQRGSSGPVL